MSTLELDAVSKRYDDFYAAKRLSLEVGFGESVVFLGPSGCGKTTALRMIAGFVTPTEGRILLDGRDITGLSPRLRNMGMVFQNYALFPSMTIAENIAFGLRQRRESNQAIRQRVGQLLELIKLEGRGDSFCNELSGGQQQRVALARALAFKPQILLMDESLSALDLKLREEMQIELRRLQREMSITMIFVTHDQLEAMTLADRIVVMNGGEIQQVGAPPDLYGRPENEFVASFIGKNNLFWADVIEARGKTSTLRLSEQLTVKLELPLPVASGSRLAFGIRPERIRMTVASQVSGNDGLVGTLTDQQFLGNITHHFVLLGDGKTVLVETSGKEERVATGSSVVLHFDSDAIRILDQRSRA